MSFGLYLHFPFCANKCPYCSFSSITGAEGLVESYIKALLIELDRRLTGKFSDRPVTVYIGGGTPSLIHSKYIKKVTERLIPDPSVEFTIEGNPESINEAWLEGILKSGANRLSIGIQSLDDTILHNLGRIHLAKDAVSSVGLARSAGFSNISVDLMFGVPGQTMEIWENTLSGVLELNPEHISCYSLGVEEDAEYFEMAEKGELELPDTEITAEMYILMVELFEKEGIFLYEISNFAIPGKECRHNRSYWNFTPYIGAGASAHSYDGNMRCWNIKDPVRYITKIMNEEDPSEECEIIDKNKQIIETIMLSLRKSEGLNMKKLQGLIPGLISILKSRIDNFVESGYMEECENGNVKLAVRGACIADEIISEIIADIL